MTHIVKHLTLVTPPEPEDGPSAFELAAIEAEMPVITAELDLLDAQIIALGRTPNELDERRIRRARRRVLAARRALANRAAVGVELPEVGA
ncbi:DUF6284 family protein [Streptomyces benahoarensis]|uniref:Uncharacterized protein n=1 Tax=Streptomyces benahoarensis TaxID=2595054 RepID=A0A553ZN37_9ACTN|nr:DUF6284 family protein [Streptomyces benahoarensis]TSB26114.1 hypothetical protein FNJ62_11545 [Streptomyces benahoarensis]TSB42888.1 hypothetical protein FNZ23_07410 [Streptomyces benahoarensis]